MSKILLVEDNESNQDMLSRRLIKKGYRVVIAANGELAIAKAQSEQPDLILMDIGLPVMDGCEATRRLRADASTCRIPVIALTAHAMKGDEQMALEAGCDEYETKPVEFRRLLSKIQTLLQTENK